MPCVSLCVCLWRTAVCVAEFANVSVAHRLLRRRLFANVFVAHRLLRRRLLILPYVALRWHCRRHIHARANTPPPPPNTASALSHDERIIAYARAVCGAALALSQTCKARVDAHSSS